MADHENDTDVNAAAAAPADAPAADAASAGDSTVNQGDQNTDAGGEGGDAGSDASQADEGSNGDGGNADEVATRRHNQQNAATRIATKNSAAPAPTDTAGGNEGGDETDLSKVQAELADLRSREEAREDEAEMDTIIGDNPDLAKYKDQVKKLASDPSRKQVPIKSLFYEAAGDDLMKIGASRASEANADAAETQQNGTSTGNAPAGTSVNDMSDTEFSKMQEEVRLKQ